LLFLNQRQRATRTVSSAPLPALDDCIDTTRPSATSSFQDRTHMDANHLGNMHPRVTLLAKDKRLAANVFERFSRKLSGIDLFHAAIISKSI
jgi:hypothetical protein